MSKRPRRNQAAAFEEKVALAAIKEEKTLSELARSSTCMPTRSPSGRVSCWRAQFGCSGAKQGQSRQRLR
jgi:transposase